MVKLDRWLLNIKNVPTIYIISEMDFNYNAVVSRPLNNASPASETIKNAPLHLVNIYEAGFHWTIPWTLYTLEMHQGAVITWSNMKLYCIHYCSSRGITWTRVWTTKEVPYLAPAGVPGVSVSEDFQSICSRYNGTVLYIKDTSICIHNKCIIGGIFY